MTGKPDWYPDPLGRHDHRWYNGNDWTADVADDGARRVDPLGTSAPQRASGTPKRRRVLIGALVIGAIVLVAPLIVLWQAVAEFTQPADHDASIEQCSITGGAIDVRVSVTNLSTETASFTVFVETTGPIAERTLRSLTIEVGAVAPRATASGSATFPSTAETVDCAIIAVGGQLPFGLDIGPVGVQE